MARDDSCFANDLKMHIVGERTGAILSFETLLSLISSQLVAIWFLLKNSRGGGALSLSLSDVYVRSFLYLFYK